MLPISRVAQLQPICPLPLPGCVRACAPLASACWMLRDRKWHRAWPCTIFINYSQITDSSRTQTKLFNFQTGMATVPFCPMFSTSILYLLRWSPNTEGISALQGSPRTVIQTLSAGTGPRLHCCYLLGSHCPRCSLLSKALPLVLTVWTLCLPSKAYSS